MSPGHQFSIPGFAFAYQCLLGVVVLVRFLSETIQPTHLITMICKSKVQEWKISVPLTQCHLATLILKNNYMHRMQMLLTQNPGLAKVSHMTWIHLAAV